MGASLELGAQVARAFVPGHVVPALLHLRKIVRPKSRVCALQGVRFSLDGERLRIDGTDLHATLSLETHLDALFASADFSAVLTLEPLVKAVKRARRGFELRLFERAAVVNVDGVASTIPFASGDDFPEPQSPDYVLAELSIDLGSLIDAITFSSAFTVQETREPLLDSVCLDVDERGELSVVGTDGYRLGVARPSSTPCAVTERACRMVLPRGGADVLRGLLSPKGELEVTTATLAIGKRVSTLKWGEYTLTFTGATGFPAWRALAEQPFSASVRVDADVIGKAVSAKRAARAMTLCSAGRDTLCLGSGKPGERVRGVPAAIDGDFPTIGFAPAHMQAVADHFDGEVSILARSPVMPAMVLRATEAAQAARARRFALLMPVRITRA